MQNSDYLANLYCVFQVLIKNINKSKQQSLMKSSRGFVIKIKYATKAS